MKQQKLTIPASFNFDHTKVLRGIYVLRRKKIGGTSITTFDIRIKEPYREPVLDLAGFHTMEHLLATYMRSHTKWGNKIDEISPMLCMTGIEVALFGRLHTKNILKFVIEAFEFMANFQGEIPGATKKRCGNYLLHDLNTCKIESMKFLNEVLYNFKQENMIYPKLN